MGLASIADSWHNSEAWRITEALVLNVDIDFVELP
jgi:hypothetical protein